MKTTIVLLVVLCGTAAFGQSIAAGVTGPSMQDIFQPTIHPQRAAVQSMGKEENLLQGSTGVYIEHGERPLWEVAPPEKAEVPLGDIARAYRKERETGKKAQLVFEK